MSNSATWFTLRLPKISAPLDWLGQDCALCLAALPARDGLVCAACRRALPALATRCLRCAAPLAHDGICGRCRRTPPRFDGAIAVYEYAFPVDRLVRRFKFAADLAVGRWLALQLAQRLRGERKPDLIVAMPLARGRLRERGFNQAAEIARVVGRTLGVRAGAMLLERTRETPAQSGLSRRARRANLRGAFRCRAAVHGRRIALVDDVITTGASAEAAARALKKAGAASVEVWAVARTPEPRAS